MTSFIRTELGDELYALGHVHKVAIQGTDEQDRWEVHFQTGSLSSPDSHVIFGGTLEQAQRFISAFIEEANDGRAVIDPIQLRVKAFVDPEKTPRSWAL